MRAKFALLLALLVGLLAAPVMAAAPASAASAGGIGGANSSAVAGNPGASGEAANSSAGVLNPGASGEAHASAQTPIKLRDYSVYDRESKLVVSLNFSAPYSADGAKIFTGKDSIKILLPGVLSEESSEKFTHQIAAALKIFARQNATVLAFERVQNASAQLLSSENKHTWLISLAPKTAPGASSPLAGAMKTEPELSGAFIKMITALGVMLILLIWLKIYLKRKNASGGGATGGASGGNRAGAKFGGGVSANIGGKDFKEAIIIYEKPLDERNKFLVLEHEGERFKLIVGASNIWLSESAKSDNFEDFFEQNRERLNQMIRQKQLQNFKEKVSAKEETQ